MSLLYERLSSREHLESQCMKKTIDQLSTLLEHNNISLPHGENKSDVGPHLEDHERFHALKACLTQLKDYLIDYGASNHMVASKECFSTLTLSRGPIIYMGDDSQILVVGRGSVKIHHGEFKNVLYVLSLIANLFYVY